MKRIYRIIPLPDGLWGVESSLAMITPSWQTELSNSDYVTYEQFIIHRPRSFKTKEAAKWWIDRQLKDQIHLAIEPEIYP